MKKLITIIIFIFSIQIFAGQYQVIKQKNVTLSKEQIEVENKKIEKMLYNYDNEKPKKILESKLPQLKNKFNKNALIELREFFPKIQKLIKEFFLKKFDIVHKHIKTKIKKIEYLSNSEAILSYEKTIPMVQDFDDKNAEKIMKIVFKRYGYEFKNFDELKTIEEYSRYIEGLSKYIMVSLEVLEEELKNPKNYRTIHEIIKLEKVKNNWESKEYEKMLDIINSIN